MIHLDIPIRPLPGPGYRHTRAGRRYTRPETQAYKDQIGAYALQVRAMQEPLDCPIVMVSAFYMQRPLKHYRGQKRQPERLKADAPRWHTAVKKYDTDNLVKPVKDAIACLFTDDGYVACEMVLKPYADDWRVRVLLAPLDEACDPEMLIHATLAMTSDAPSIRTGTCRPTDT